MTSYATPRKYAINVKRQKHPPLRTFAEMAEEFGVSTSTLRQAFGNTKETPPPAVTAHASRAGKNSYYDPKLMRAWWVAHQASKTATQKGTP